MPNNLSFWEKQHFFNADVIIVGTGIVGLNAALTLKLALPHLDILVLERGFLPSGASTKNAGFACFGSVSELIEQEKRAGTDGLFQILSKRWNGLLKLRSIVGDKNLSFENFGGYELFKKNNDDELANQCVLKISHYNQILADILAEKQTFKVANGHISTFGFNQISTLIANSLEAQIDPGKMMKALHAKVTAIGVRIYTQTELQNFHPEENCLSLETNQGNFKCTKLIMATNAFIQSLLPELDVVPGRGQVVITKPLPSLKIKGTFHYDKGYYYFRNVGDRVLLGGGRNLDFLAEQKTSFGETPVVQDALNNLLKTIILPDQPFEIDMKWSGIMAFGKEIEPIVKEIKPNIFCAVRCNGMGIAIGSQTGQEVAELVLKTY